VLRSEPLPRLSAPRIPSRRSRGRLRPPDPALSLAPLHARLIDHVETCCGTGVVAPCVKLNHAVAPCVKLNHARCPPLQRRVRWEIVCLMATGLQRAQPTVEGSIFIICTAMHQHLPRDKHHGTRHQRSVVVSSSGYLVLMGCSARMHVSSCSIAVKPHGIAACDEGRAMVRQAAAAAMSTQQTGVARCAGCRRRTDGTSKKAAESRRPSTNLLCARRLQAQDELRRVMCGDLFCKASAAGVDGRFEKRG
jgi:hypothetical protein